ncbi:MAG: YraN family protein [Acidobacteriota bacterium]
MAAQGGQVAPTSWSEEITAPSGHTSVGNSGVRDVFASLASGLDRLRDHRRVRTWSHDLAVGRRGEDLAHRYLEALGFTIIARNYELPSGDAEADVIARDGDELVIVEVKTRETNAFGPPERAMGLDKQRALTRVARAYAQKTSIALERTRCDLISIILRPEVKIEHFRDAVRLFHSR